MDTPVEFAELKHLFNKNVVQVEHLLFKVLREGVELAEVACLVADPTDPGLLEAVRVALHMTDEEKKLQFAIVLRREASKLFNEIHPGIETYLRDIPTTPGAVPVVVLARGRACLLVFPARLLTWVPGGQA